MEAARPFLKKLPKDHKFAVETATKAGSQRALREVRFFKFSHRRTAQRDLFVVPPVIEILVISLDQIVSLNHD